MSLLTICQDSADGIGITRPASVVGNNDPEVQKLYRCAKKVGLRLMKVFPWQVLRKEQTFTSVATEAQTSILPSDFDRFCKETFWNRSTPALISGPVSNVEWQGLKAYSYSDTQFPKFAYRGDSVLVTPTLSAGDSLAFEYVSKNWCQTSGSVAQATWAADSDTGIINEELMTLGIIFDYLDAEGQPTQKAAMDFNDYYNTLTGNENPDAGMMVAGDIFGSGRHFDGVPVVSYGITNI